MAIYKINQHESESAPSAPKNVERVKAVCGLLFALTSSARYKYRLSF